MREFAVVIEQDEDGIYVVSVPELPGSQGRRFSSDLLVSCQSSKIERF